MPTYEYRCKECGHQFEEFQNITAEPIKECPACQGKVERLISGGTGLIFKGSGFYITDYQRNSNGAASSNEKKSTEKKTSKKKSSDSSDKKS